MIWIASNGRSGTWHVGVRRESRGAVTGKLFAVYFKTRCNNRTLGGPYGYSKRDVHPGDGMVCARCEALAAKDELARVAFRAKSHGGCGGGSPVGCCRSGAVTTWQAELRAAARAAERQLRERFRSTLPRARGPWIQAEPPPAYTNAEMQELLDQLLLLAITGCDYVERGDTERALCPDAGLPGHRSCGWCTTHESQPRFLCGCMAPARSIQ